MIENVKEPKPKWFSVLKTGRFTGGNGVTIDIDEARLDRIVKNYNAELCETPLVLGHPKTDDPSYGWVEKFRRVGNILQALPKKLIPEFAEAVNKGMYQYVSCKVRPNDTIAHVGFLGAVAPCVKGLGVVTLSENDEGVDVELSQADLWVEKRLFRRILSFIQRMRDQAVAEKGIEAGDALISNDELGYLQSDIDNLEQEQECAASSSSMSTLSEPETGKEGNNVDPKELQRLLDIANARIAELSEKVESLGTQNVTLTTELSNLQTKISVEQGIARETEFSEFCDEQIKAGKLPSGEKRSTMTLMETLFQAGDIELSEADGKTKTKKSALEYLKQQISLRKPSVEFGEIATQERQALPTELSEAAELSEKMSKYMDEQAVLGNIITVVDALAFVKKAVS